MNKNIAVLTAGILAVGLLGIASHTGSTSAASSGHTANFGGMFTSHAKALQDNPQAHRLASPNSCHLKLPLEMQVLLVKLEL